MNADEIKQVVAFFRAQEMAKIHVRINCQPDWRKDERLVEEMRTFEVRMSAYRAGLGEPDDAQSIAQDEPAPAVTPGTKG